MGMVEISGYPPINEAVEAWISIEWLPVMWTGRHWMLAYNDGECWRMLGVIDVAITHWRHMGTWR